MIRVRRKGIIFDANIVGIDITVTGVFLVLERADNQKKYRIHLGGMEDLEMNVPPDPGPTT